MPDTEQRAWNFDRYVNGVLMAEGVSITRADTLEQAVKKAVQLCPKRQGTVLVLSDGIREEVIEEAAKVADAHVQRARDAVSQCPKWTSVQAEWSRARDLGLDIAEAIRALSQRQP